MREALLPAFAGTDAGVDPGAKMETLLLSLSLGGLPLSRIVSDALKSFDRQQPGGSPPLGSASKRGAPPLKGVANGGRGSGGSSSSGGSAGGEGSDLNFPAGSFLPAGDARVFAALARRISHSEEGGEAGTSGVSVEAGAGPGTGVGTGLGAGAIVRQIVSQLDLALNHGPPGGVATMAMFGGGCLRRTLQEEALLLSAGLRLASRACLGLLVASTAGSGAVRARMEVGVGAEAGAGAGAVAGHPEAKEGGEGGGAGGGGRSRAGGAAAAAASSSRQAFEALADVFRRPFLLRLACPLSGEAAAAGVEAGALEAHRGGDSEQGVRSFDLGELACADMAALLVAAVAAEEGSDAADASATSASTGRRRRRRGAGAGIAAEAARPFLERLCRWVGGSASVAFFLYQYVLTLMRGIPLEYCARAVFKYRAQRRCARSQRQTSISRASACHPTPLRAWNRHTPVRAPL